MPWEPAYEHTFAELRTNWFAIRMQSRQKSALRRKSIDVMPDGSLNSNGKNPLHGTSVRTIEKRIESDYDAEHWKVKPHSNDDSKEGD